MKGRRDHSRVYSIFNKSEKVTAIGVKTLWKFAFQEDDLSFLKDICNVMYMRMAHNV